MPDEPSQEELLQQQKANCIFCRIVKGEIPSKQVYVDERMVAILDINPATKGHVLVMTKEHYPIMPLLPPEEFSHLFGTAAALSGAVAKGSLAPRCSTFIANGAVAGQQSPHFLFHLIPREQGDGLESLAIPEKGVNQSAAAGMIKANLYAIMRQHLTKTGKLDLLQVGAPVEKKTTEPPSQERPRDAEPTTDAPIAASPQSTPLVPFSPPHQSPSPAELARIIEQNPELRQIIIEEPERLKAILGQNPELSSLFRGIDLIALSAQLRGTHEPRVQAGQGRRFGREATEEQQDKRRTPSDPAEEDAENDDESEAANAGREGGARENPGDGLIPALHLTMTELFAFIDAKERLRGLMITDPERLKRLIPEQERLRRFFEGSDVDAIIQAYREHARETPRGASVLPDRQARELTMRELFAFIDAKERLRGLMITDPERLKRLIPEQERLRWFFEGSNVNAIIQAYQEYAKERHGVRVTVEPEAEARPREPARKPEGPSREEEDDAYEEMRDHARRRR